jgi:hypothetical protein
LCSHPGNGICAKLPDIAQFHSRMKNALWGLQE